MHKDLGLCEQLPMGMRCRINSNKDFRCFHDRRQSVAQLTQRNKSQIDWKKTQQDFYKCKKQALKFKTQWTELEVGKIELKRESVNWKTKFSRSQDRETWEMKNMRQMLRNREETRRKPNKHWELQKAKRTATREQMMVENQRDSSPPAQEIKVISRIKLNTHTDTSRGISDHQRQRDHLKSSQRIEDDIFTKAWWGDLQLISTQQWKPDIGEERGIKRLWIKKTNMGGEGIAQW